MYDGILPASFEWTGVPAERCTKGEVYLLYRNATRDARRKENPSMTPDQLAQHAAAAYAAMPAAEREIWEARAEAARRDGTARGDVEGDGNAGLAPSAGDAAGQRRGEDGGRAHHAVMPILRHLMDGERRAAGWHRAEERRARGLAPPEPSAHLEPWERQLAVLEMALVAGTRAGGDLSPDGRSRLLAHAWGRRARFHKLLIEQVCARRGTMARKRRADAGQPMSASKKAHLQAKRCAARAAKGGTAEPSAQEAVGNRREVSATAAAANTSTGTAGRAESAVEPRAPPLSSEEAPNEAEETVDEPAPSANELPDEYGQTIKETSDLLDESSIEKEIEIEDDGEKYP